MIQIENLTKFFNNKKIINNVNLKINKGELVVLIGPSGCGKTTTLKMINKLLKPDSGKIFINGSDISKMDTIELRRNIGYVIQQTGLFPHMTIRENIGIVPSLKKWNKKQISKRTEELMKLAGMKSEDYLNRYPNELSGGQRQRIGVIRALAANPEIILMDEPFSALDPITRSQLQDELFNLQQTLKKTIVFVTHDMSEALKLGDRICIMKDGNILQFDTPENILKNPSNDFIKEFIGKNRIWEKPEYIKVKDIMISQPVMASGNRTVIQGIEIMKQNKVDSLMVVSPDSTLEGIVTQKSIRKINDMAVKLEAIMSKDFIRANQNDSILDVLKYVNGNGIGFIPVVNESKLVGLITKSSLLEVLSSQYINEEVTI